MKKLFVCLMTSLCSTFAFAASEDFIMSSVFIQPGATQDLVFLFSNPESYTAFQFDLTLPKGISVEDAKLGGEYGADRKFEKALVDEANNKYRFLSYDMKNAKLNSKAIDFITVTLKAAADMAIGEVDAETTDVLFVDPEGNSVEVAGDETDINVEEKNEITIDIPEGGKLAMVSDKDLDFTSLEAKGVKAYICTGYETETKNFWMTRVKDVPANTPILVMGKGTHTVPVGTSRIYYPKNFFIGDAKDNFSVDKSEGYLNFVITKSKGTIASMPSSTSTMDAGKAYLHVPADVASNVASDKQEFKMGVGKKLLTVSDYDLDFSSVEGLKAYVSTGFDLDRNIWLSRVMKVSAGTPIELIGEQSEGVYNVPSAATKVAYVNMFVGNTSSSAVTISPEMDGNVVYVLQLSKGTYATIGKDASMAKGKAWLLVPKTFYSRISASRGNFDINDEEAEVICIKAGLGGEDDGTTGIRSVDEGQFTNDTWYNLNGQRIDTPMRKGLYIKNGKKVVVK